jgi:hypothetical protein
LISSSRSCDSPFGPGAINEEELGWFSSADAVEGSGDALNGGSGMVYSLELLVEKKKL